LFQKNSFSIPSDSSGILLTKVIQTRKCNSRKHAKIGKFLKVVIKNTKTTLNKVKKKKSRAIVVRTKHMLLTKKGKYYNFMDNALVLLKKRMNTRGKELYGPTSKFLKIKKFIIAYRCIF
jgi:ribosomal protein L14